MIKKKIDTIYRKNEIINNIINAIVERKSFLICGHKNPDEDCISSMIAIAIILTKFDKIIQIYLDGYIPENIKYLLDICKYNSIELINHNSKIPNSIIDTLIICDTPKFDMLDINYEIEEMFKRKDILKIEFDHHISCDGEYIGDDDYSLVTDASSASELIGILAIKLKNKRRILKRYMIHDPLSRNLVLAIITGIVGDTNMGQYLKSRREKKIYNIFSNLYNDILMKVTVRDTNFNKIEQVFYELQKLSSQEKECYNYIIQKHHFKKNVGYIILNQKKMKYINDKFDDDIFISVSKHAANNLAEESKKLSLLAYYDNPQKSDLIQFRMRRCHSFKEFDLREVMNLLSISNGGGHEGAIGFRIPKDSIKDLDNYVSEIIEVVSTKINRL